MNKILGGMSLIALSSIAFSGTVGDVQTDLPHFMPFVSLDGSFTDSAGKNFNFSHSKLNSTEAGYTGPTSNNSQNPWGARLAGGVIFPYFEKISFAAETGWNYFGNSTNNHGGYASFSVDGADLLVGLDYTYQKYGLFVRAGTLFERVLYKLSAESQANIASTTRNVTVNFSNIGSNFAALPELKIGGLYHFNDNWVLSLSYMHAFGFNPTFSETINSVSNALVIDFNSNTRTPTLDSVLLGIRYNFTRLA